MVLIENHLVQLSEVRQAEGGGGAGGGTVCWHRCTLCLHELTAAVTQTEVVIVICSVTQMEPAIQM